MVCVQASLVKTQFLQLALLGWKGALNVFEGWGSGSVVMIARSMAWKLRRFLILRIRARQSFVSWPGGLEWYSQDRLGL